MGANDARRFMIPIFIIAIVVTAASIWMSQRPKEPEEEEALKIGVVMWGHHDEGLWDPAAANAVLRLQEKYDLEITWAEEIVLTELESLLRNLATVNDIVYLTTDEFEEACKAVAPDFPDVYWIQQYETRELAPDHFPENVVVLNAYQANELSFLAGAIAAKVTETDKLGVVQAIAGPRDTRIMSAAFRSGARYVNPDIEVLRVVIGGYVDPIKTRDSVASFAEAGVDVVFVGMDDESGTLEAKERGIYSIQEYMDITTQFPDTMIGCTTWQWDVGIDLVLDAIVNGRFDEFRAENHEIPLTLEDRSLDIPVYGDMVTEEVRAFAAELREKIIDGTVEIPMVEEW